MDLHGGNIYRLKREGKGELLDYSSNINPLGVPEEFKKKVIENFELLEKYPDPDYIELRENIGRYNGVDLKNIVVGNGATEILFLYMKSLKPKKTFLIAPSFAEYRRALESIDCEIIYHILDEKRDFKLDIDKFVESIPQCDLVIICNPNNPTGNFLKLEEIKKINDQLKKRGIKLFIDEAFIEFIREWENFTAVNLKDSNIFVMRALTKFFAVPGVRLGYGITYDSEILEKSQKYKEPWSINSFADLAGKTMLWDREYIEKSENWIEEEKEWFYNETLKIKGIKSYKTNSNFILIKLIDKTSVEVREKMIQRGILVRDASNFIGLDKHFIRLAIKDRENNKIVLEALSEVVR
ncbi:histidinol-phosphate transaminase [Fusobacterium sp. SYSU M8D902]|uniref:pyridoxal phosphate-dependent aminotransferase n=1 Tax=Fusobacterium sp. SYSU M8D902 TaxID=3159562 RepID=UPI0032E410E7